MFATADATALPVEAEAAANAARVFCPAVDGPCVSSGLLLCLPNGAYCSSCDSSQLPLKSIVAFEAGDSGKKMGRTMCFGYENYYAR